MLLECCDISLKDWLSNITKVTTDELENMLTFSLNIANGVEHLHKQKVNSMDSLLRCMIDIKDSGLYMS